MFWAFPKKQMTEKYGCFCFASNMLSYIEIGTGGLFYFLLQIVLLNESNYQI